MSILLKLTLALFSIAISPSENTVTVKLEIDRVNEKICKKAYLQIVDGDDIYKVKVNRRGVTNLSFLGDLKNERVDVIFSNRKYEIKIDSVLASKMKYDLVFGIMTKNYVSDSLLKGLNVKRETIKHISYLAFRPKTKHEGTVKYSIVY